MAKEILRKKRSATPMQVKAKKKNSANLMAATKNSVGGIHVYLRSSDNRIKTKIVYNTGLDDRDYEPCNLTASDVTTLYSELNQHFQSLKQGGDSENLRNLIAEEGWYLYNKLVPDEDKAKLSEIHSQYLSEQEAVGDKIIFPPKQILIKANGVTVPWELLYMENPHDEKIGKAVCDERYFLGYWAIIKQDITPNSQNDLLLSDFGPYGVKVFFDHNLDVARDEEAPAIQAMFQSAGFKSHIARELTEDASAKGFFAEIFRQPGCIIHMACHSENKPASEGQSFICVNKNYLLVESEVRRSPQVFDHMPILFLNSCELAMIKPESYCQFLNYFFERGFSAIVATEIEIDDRAAWDFAKRVYSGFLSSTDTTFDLAIFNARRGFLIDFDSLIGFTYSYYGLGNLAISSTNGGTHD